MGERALSFSDEARSFFLDYLFILYINPPMDKEEIKKYACLLGRHSLFFRTLWDLTSIKFDDNIPTACIEFSRQNSKPLGMKIGTKFWNESNEEERLFILAHELCHVIFDHQKRFRSFASKIKNQAVCNAGMDVSINEMLVRQFGFKRELLVHEVWKDTCWLNTCWPDKNMPSGKSADWYIQKLIEDNKYQTKVIGVKMKGASGEPMPFDGHEWMDEDCDEIIELDDLVTSGEAKDFIERLTKDQHENDLGGKKAGSGGTSSWKDIVEPSPPKKRKWESVIRRWIEKVDVPNFSFHERWFGTSPRYSEFQKGKAMLPFERFCLDESKEKHKIRVAFFLDTSGSCSSLGPRFFKAAQSIPNDRFIVDLFYFDDIVVQASLKDKKVRLGGGTRFDIIENKCLEMTKYPDAVWVLTDGYGTNFSCKSPSKWNWFLTDQSSTANIPKGSKIHYLKNFE